MLSPRLLCLIGTVCAVVLVSTQADAHARVVASTPVAGATITSTRVVTVTFNERVVPAFSGLAIASAAGSTVAMTSTVSTDGKTITGRATRTLSPGAYSVNWHAASSDGHRMTGVIAFSVR